VRASASLPLYIASHDDTLCARAARPSRTPKSALPKIICSPNSPLYKPLPTNPRAHRLPKRPDPCAQIGPSVPLWKDTPTSPRTAPTRRWRAENGTPVPRTCASRSVSPGTPDPAMNAGGELALEPDDSFEQSNAGPRQSLVQTEGRPSARVRDRAHAKPAASPNHPRQPTRPKGRSKRERSQYGGPSASWFVPHGAGGVDAPPCAFAETTSQHLDSARRTMRQITSNSTESG